MQNIFQSEYVILIYLYNNHSFINRLVSTQRSYITTQVQEDNKTRNHPQKRMKMKIQRRSKNATVLFESIKARGVEVSLLIHMIDIIDD